MLPFNLSCGLSGDWILPQADGLPGSSLAVVVVVVAVVVVAVSQSVSR